MKNCTSLRRLLCSSASIGGALAAAVAGASAFAQTVLPAKKSAVANDEVVTLPEFAVTTEQDGSYDASDSLVGSRVRTQIRELPYNLNVVTSELIQDFAAFEVAEQLAYTSSFAIGQSNGFDYTLRGISGSASLRNGFRSPTQRVSANVARIEVIKGPAASLYGQTSPGGILNTVTKRPKAMPETNLSVSIGNYDILRAYLSTTGPLGDNRGVLRETSYRFTIADNREHFETSYTGVHDLQGAFIATKKFGPETSFTLELEYTIQDSIRQLPLPYNTATVGGRTIYTGFAYDLFGFNTNSPQAIGANNRGIVFLTFEHRFDRILSMRAALTHTEGLSESHNYIGDASAFNPRRINTREQEHALQGSRSRGAQVDLVAQFRTRAIEHRSLLTFDYSYQRSTRDNVRIANANLNNPAFNVRTLFIDNPNYFLLPFTSANYPRISTASDDITAIYGVFYRHQISAFDGRLIAMAGLRYDYVDFDLTDKVRVPYTVEIYSAHALKSQFGVNYKIAEPLVAYLNRAESFVPPTSSGVTSVSANASLGAKFKNEEGLGYEAGVKSALLANRLNATLAYYDIERQNVRTTEVETVPAVDSQGRPIIDPATGKQRIDSVNVAATAGLERSRGVEIDFNWKVNAALQLFGGYGYNDSYIVRAGRDLDAIGRPPRSNPHHRGGAGLRYAINSGRLKGVAVTLGATYMDETYYQNPTSNGTADRDGFIRSNDGRRELMTPSSTVWNVGTSYRFRSKFGERRLEHRVQLNLKNLLDKKYVDNRMRPANRLTIVGGYDLTF